MSSGRISSAPHAPKPPAFATAIDNDGALAPAIGARSIGTWMPNRRQNSAVRSSAILPVTHRPCLVAAIRGRLLVARDVGRVPHCLRRIVRELHQAAAVRAG